MKRAFPIARFLLSCAAVTVIFGTIYAALQQNIRQSANDPQIQMAEDAAAALSVGAVPASVMPADRTVIDASTSLSPFIMVFDENGTLLESSMKVGDTLPVPPKGVFDFTRSNAGEVFSGPLAPISRLRMQFASNVRPAGEDRITWQTATGLRFATVIIHWSASSGGAISSGFVLAGRSLREVENREGQLVWIVLAGWVVALVMTAVISLLYSLRSYIVR
jgi:hypothetical protein